MQIILYLIVGLVVSVIRIFKNHLLIFVIRKFYDVERITIKKNKVDILIKSNNSDKNAVEKKRKK